MHGGQLQQNFRTFRRNPSFVSEEGMGDDEPPGNLGSRGRGLAVCLCIAVLVAGAFRANHWIVDLFAISLIGFLQFGLGEKLLQAFGRQGAQGSKLSVPAQQPKKDLTQDDQESLDFTINVIGFGGVGHAFFSVLPGLIERGELPKKVKAIRFFAPEIPGNKQVTDLISLHPCPFVTAETYMAFLDELELVPGDIVVELGTRISTKQVWGEVKKRGCHFVNTGFDTWADQDLTMSDLVDLTKLPHFTPGCGPTSVLSCGFNPGVISHFVAHGLRMATGIEDTKKAAVAFGLSSITLIERDSQLPREGSEGEKLINRTYQDVCYCTWSPGNYVVECAESPIWFECMPAEAGEYKASGPSVIAWLPEGPVIGNVIPHDETFTMQTYFEKSIPCAFVYEAPPTARGYVKSNSKAHVDSNSQKADLLCPFKHDLDKECFDYLGALLISNKPGVAPFWCGAVLNVEDAVKLDPTGETGPTPMQVIGGLWSALTYVFENKNGGDCFSEALPTAHVIKRCFPFCGELVCRSAPESAGLTHAFDPANSMATLLTGMPNENAVAIRNSEIHGKGTFAECAMQPSTLVLELPTEPEMGAQIEASVINHSCDPNCYVDRHWNVRSSRPIATGEEITVDYATFLSPELRVGDVCACKSSICRKTIGAEIPKVQLAELLKSCPIITDIKLRKILSR